MSETNTTNNRKTNLRGAGQVNVYKQQQTHPRRPTKQLSMFEFEAVQRRLDEHEGDVMPDKQMSFF
jgi:hypothetical protein